MLNININKYGVFFEVNGEIVKLDDKTVDDLAKKSLVIFVIGTKKILWFLVIKKKQVYKLRNNDYFYFGNSW